jgi:hypothetical protein
VAARNTQAELARSGSFLRFKERPCRSTRVLFPCRKFQKGNDARGKWFKVEQVVMQGFNASVSFWTRLLLILRPERLARLCGDRNLAS